MCGDCLNLIYPESGYWDGMGWETCVGFTGVPIRGRDECLLEEGL
jgi:hypothetical protein